MVICVVHVRFDGDCWDWSNYAMSWEYIEEVLHYDMKIFQIEVENDNRTCWTYESKYWTCHCYNNFRNWFWICLTHDVCCFRFEHLMKLFRWESERAVHTGTRKRKKMKSALQRKLWSLANIWRMPVYFKTCMVYGCTIICKIRIKMQNDFVFQNMHIWQDILWMPNIKVKELYQIWQFWFWYKMNVYSIFNFLLDIHWVSGY